MMFSLFWDVTLRRLIVIDRRFGTNLSVLCSRVKQFVKTQKGEELTLAVDYVYLLKHTNRLNGKMQTLFFRDLVRVYIHCDVWG